MVFGIGEGKLEISLEKTAFVPGDSVIGTVRLNMGGPQKARGLRIEFFGLQKRGSKTVRLHHVSQHLSSARSYAAGEQFKFMLLIPYNAFPKTHESIFTPVASLLGGHSPVKWYVSASLDLPMKLDLSDKKQIHLQSAQQGPGLSIPSFTR